MRPVHGNMTMLIAGGYLLLSEPARSAAEYAQWRQAKTMTLGEKSYMVHLLLQMVLVFDWSAVRFDFCPDIPIVITTKMDGLSRAFGDANTATLA